MVENNNYCVILAGGVGARFWPFSRQKRPKQFLDFFGVGRSLLQQTFDRFLKIIPFDHIFIVTNEDYKLMVTEQLPGLDETQILLEPTRRNTAPCVAWAACHIRALNPNANLIFTPSDHLILKEELFLKMILKGLDFVDTSNKLLVLGSKATRPETRYGYIQVSDEGKLGDFYKAKSFTEKPDLEFAKMLIDTGEFYWNTGLFMWNVNVILDAIRKFIPEVAAKLRLVENIDISDYHSEMAFIEDAYPSCPYVSIDYGIMEKADNVYVLLGDFGWADLGTWDTVYEASPKDKDGNVVMDSQTMMYRCKNNIVKLPRGKLGVFQDMDGYMVIDTNDVLMISKKEDDQSVRNFVTDTQLKLGDKYI
jgi:mannose-1-phosphate guanylyltransferase